MRKGVSKTIILGYVGSNPDVRYTKDGTCVVNISVATNESWTDKKTGAKSERTEWHRIVIFGPPAQFTEQYVRKGDLVYVEGSNVTRKWKDKNGETRYTTEVNARNLQKLTSKSDHPSDDQPADDQQDDFQDDDLPF